MQSSSRNGAKVRVLAVHTTEGIMRAADLRAWTTWPGSSHASADETGVLMTPADGFVPYDRSAWTLRNGNPWSENIELCGFAKWKRPDWLARPKLLDACARWLAERSVARGIPLVKLTPKELAAGRSGVIGHHDYTVGYSDGTHWDPGPDFPYDVVLSKAAAYANGQNLTSEEDELMAAADDIADIQRRMVALYDAFIPDPADTSPFARKITDRGEMGKRIRGIHELVSDPSALATALRAKLGDLAGGSQPVSQEMLEAALRKVLGSVDA